MYLKDGGILPLRLRGVARDSFPLIQGVGRQTLFHKDEGSAPFERVMVETYPRGRVGFLVEAQVRD